MKRWIHTYLHIKWLPGCAGCYRMFRCVWGNLCICVSMYVCLKDEGPSQVYTAINMLANKNQATGKRYLSTAVGC